MARFKVRSNCIAPFAWTPHDRLDPDRDRGGEAARRALPQMTPEKIAPLAVYLGSDAAEGISGQIFSVRNNEIFLFNQNRADPHPAPLRRLDAGEDRRAAQGRVRAVVHAARSLRRRVLLGSGVMSCHCRACPGNPGIQCGRRCIAITGSSPARVTARMTECDEHGDRLRQADGAEHSGRRAHLRRRRTACSTRSASASATIR